MSKPKKGDLKYVVFIGCILLLIYYVNSGKNIDTATNSSNNAQVSSKGSKEEETNKPLSTTSSENQNREDKRQRGNTGDFAIDEYIADYSVNNFKESSSDIAKDNKNINFTEIKESYKRVPLTREEFVVKVETVVNDVDELLLARLIMSEAGIEPYEGKVAVGSVIINRTKWFKKSIKEIIFQPHQFDGVQTKWFFEDPNEESKRASKEVLSGVNNMPEAYAFCDLNLCSPDWAIEKYFIKRIGDHWFYREDYKIATKDN